MLITLTGPSGVGKGYLKEKILAAFPHLSELVWLTTRPLRIDEVAAQSNRHHVTAAELVQLRQQNELAYEQSLFGHEYALANDEIERSRTHACITEMHVNTLRILKSSVPDIIAIAIIPGNTDLLRTRLLINRGVVLDTETQARLAAAEQEVQAIKAMSTDFALIVEVSVDNEAHIESSVLSFLSQHITP